MSEVKLALAALSCLFWMTTLYLCFAAWLLGIAPNGLAGSGYDDEGPSSFAHMLGTLGPAGVLLIASTIYASAFWLRRRLRKDC